MNDIFGSILTGSTVGITQFLLCTLAAVFLGVLVSLYYMYKNIYTKGFACTLVLLPAMVSVVIMLVNGNLGAGIATMGAFSLIRFRSIAGNAKDISCVFLSMAIGLACGMGYVMIAVVFTVLIVFIGILLSASRFGNMKQSEKLLKITIPEHLDYSTIFDDLFEKYTTSSELIQVKTIHMGSLYKCEYHITLKDLSKEKEMIDEMRTRNGNLEISCGKITMGKEEL